MARLASVIIANYNYGRFLGEAIESVLAQTYAPLEVIVVDDGSTDESRDVIARFGDRVRSILKPNGGQASAWNAGFAASAGDVVIFLDSDDVLLPGALTHAMLPFDDPAVAKVHWPVWLADEAGASTGRVFPASELPDGNFAAELCRLGPTHKLSAPTSGNAWARWFLTDLFPVPEELFKTHADTLLFEAAPFFGSIRALPEPLTLWRQHPDAWHLSDGPTGKVQRELCMYEYYAPLLARRCRALGLEAEPERWRASSWWHRQAEAIEALKALPDPDRPLIVADEGTWETGPIAGRCRLPFLEANGQYAGPPADDGHAITELKRLHAAGARFIAFAWPSFWWLNHYKGLRAHLEHLPRVIASEHVIVFDLDGSPGLETGVG